MRRRPSAMMAVLLSVGVLGALALSTRSPEGTRAAAAPVPVTAPQTHESPFELPVRAESKSASEVVTDPADEAPVDVTTREHFNERARDFFANAAQWDAQTRVLEARQLAHDLTRLEQAGGLSAGETLLIRAGLIRETVPAGAQQNFELQELQQRYRSETQIRLAAAKSRPDPQFEVYKVRESEIVNEVMALQTIPEGLSRDEYLRRRLQSAREQLTP